MVTRGNLTAFVIVAVFIATITFLGGCSVSPPMFAGDRLEQRTCRWCNGTGKDDSGEDPRSNGRCPGCGGAQKVSVIVPGPKHPVPVKGTIRDLSAFKDADEAAMEVIAESSKPLEPIRGAVPDAQLVFQGPAGKVDVAGMATGRFRCALEPGAYKVTVTAKDFQPYSLDVEVTPLQHPLWQEKAHLRTPEKDEDTVFVPVLLLRK